MLKAQLQPAYVLHQRPYRDTSVLLEVFSRDYGRLGLVARGARGSRAPQRGLLQPFQPLLMSWRGRGELATLQQVESNGASHRLSGSLLYSGFYLNELLLRLLQRSDPHPELFIAYQTTLQGLQAETQRSLRLFEKQLLESIGYALLLDQEAHSGAPIVSEALYRYELELGPISVERATPRGLCLPGSSLLSLATGDLSDAQSLADSKRLMRAALALYLGGRELKTREVFAVLAARSSRADSASEPPVDKD